jgi:hypothetical protein
MADGSITDEELAELVRRTENATSAYMRWRHGRYGSDWHVVHRHVDPLVHAIDLEQAAALARG